MTTRAEQLSTMQERLWFLWQLDPSATHYNITFGWRVTGRKTPAVAQAARTLLTRHRVLRGAYRSDEQGTPQRVTLRPDEVPVRYLALTGDDDRAARTVQELVTEMHRTPFDLDKGSARCLIAEEPGGTTSVVWTCHHIAVDAWSIGVLRDELCTLLDGEATGLPDQPAQYEDFVAWEEDVRRGPDAASAVSRRARIATATRPTTPWPRLPGPGPSATAAGEAHAVIDGAGFQALSRLAATEGVTLYGLGLAACAVALAEWCAASEVTVGANIAKRAFPGGESVVGMLVDPLVLRLAVHRGAPLRRTVQDVWDHFLDLVEHSDAPHVDVLRAAADMGADTRGPLFDVIVTCSEEEVTVQHGAVRLDPLPAPAPTTVKFGLSVEFVTSPGRLRLHVIHPDSGQEAAQVARFVDRLTGVLRAMAAEGLDTPVPPPPVPRRPVGRFAGLLDTPTPRP
ncbi:condensation domain-containing protein [Streptomyces sp. NPDC053069]|uniref:condensation domain-containing protein n=1 Tax=Streptomyces sp. NPDC053069 TaxID=3365695 RepID=UPI0037D6CC05